MGKDPILSLTFVVVFVLAVLLAAVLTIGYEYATELLANMSRQKVATLQISTLALMTGVPLGVGALVFNSSVLTAIVLLVVVAELLWMVFGGALVSLSTGSQDKTIARGDIRELLGTVGSILSIIEFIAFVVVIILGLK
jgi:hypothetical protein